MAFEIPEQAKYRLTGGLIMISLAFFVLPGLMQKSNQRFEESIAKHTAVPPKPKAPRLAIPSRQESFESLGMPTPVLEPKIAERKLELQLSKAEPLVLTQVPQVEKQVKVDPPKPKLVKTVVSSKEKIAAANYSVQLAAFSHQENANFLIQRLKKMGYAAQVFKIPSQSGGLYQVVVGRLDDKEHAIALQKKLSDNLQLQGLVIHKDLG